MNPHSPLGILTAMLVAFTTLALTLKPVGDREEAIQRRVEAQRLPIQAHELAKR